MDDSKGPIDKNRRAPELQQQLDHIGDRFVQRLLTELTMMRELVIDMRTGEHSVLHDLELFAHKIHGSSAMFGFGDLSRCAGEFEAMLTRERLAGTNLATSLPAIEAAFERLHEAGVAASKRGNGR